MATDIRQIVLDLAGFYDFTDKTVIDVGAGGGQLVEYARAARQVIAIDCDPSALARLEVRLHESGLADKFSLIAADFLAVISRGDVVLFEFCLHEMVEPKQALAHAPELAPDVLVIDHAPGSPWSWYAAEDSAVEAAWQAVEHQRIRRHRAVEAVQRFDDYSELETKLAPQGRASLERIACFRGQRNISIPMPYQLALLSFEPRLPSSSVAR